MLKRVKKEDIKTYLQDGWQMADISDLRSIKDYLRYKRYWYPFAKRCYRIWNIKREFYASGTMAHLVLVRKSVTQK